MSGDLTKFSCFFDGITFKKEEYIGNKYRYNFDVL